MMKIKILLPMLVAGLSVAEAATYVWNGSGDGVWSTKANWTVDGVEGAGSPTPSKDSYNGMPRHAVRIEGNMRVEGSDASLGVGTNWKSFGGCKFYIEKGSTLVMSSSSLAFRQATFYVSGDKGLVWNSGKKKEPISGAGTAVNFELGTEGSIDFGNSAWVSGAYAIFGATLDLNQAGKSYVATRTLVYGWGSGNLPTATDTYTPYKVASSLPDVTTEYKNGALDASTDDVGTWTVSIVDKNLVLSYVTKDGLIPEPGTASLGLLGLGCLVFRRRRGS